MPSEPNLHRNNAAEWMMVAMVWPAVMACRILDRVRRKWNRHSGG
jgi:hypothetical protein